MLAEPPNCEAENPGAATAADEAVKAGQQVFDDVMATAEKLLADATRTAEKALKEGVEALKANAAAYSGPAGQTVDDARRYVIERVKERPVTATLAGIGVGFLLGVLLSSRGE
jgi:ElaB/YqjD/DUF883 family membrane-anchored ribosome-binding protein